MSMTCKICSECAEHPIWKAKERMLGLGGEFLYFQCNACSCLQIADIPENLSAFYPIGYYSFNAQGVPRTGWKANIAALRDRATALGKQDPISSVICKLIPPRPDLRSIAAVKPTFQSRILDVGCGSGQLLSVLHRAGFRNLAGIDPFIDSNKEIAKGVVLEKKTIEQVEGQFDLIMLHHVFEHMLDGEKALAECRKRIALGGKILLRFPTPDSFAWRKYRERWVQLDAPRHLFLHSRRSMELLAARLALRVEKWFCDSSEFQFLGSELYLRELSLSGARMEEQFSPGEITEYRAEARRLNQQMQGDQVVVVLSPVKE